MLNVVLKGFAAISIDFFTQTASLPLTEDNHNLFSFQFCRSKHEGFNYNVMIKDEMNCGTRTLKSYLCFF